jgi:alkaline phosphatase D
MRLLPLLLVGTLFMLELQAQDPAAASPGPPALTHGPMLGDLRPASVRIWARLDGPGERQLRIVDEEGQEVFRQSARARAEHDFVLTWLAPGLLPASTYRYGIGPKEHSFRTPPKSDAPAKVSLAFGSCADDRKYPSQPIWQAIERSGAQAMVTLGDTPYIDSTDVLVQRARYRALYAVPELRALQAKLPFYGTWDDHDFGRNDTDGRLPGKRGSRQGFMEYHLQPTYGQGGAGIYSSFRWGPVEVFLLDARWFAATTKSPFAPAQPTLLGASQWRWLKHGLKHSTADFKLLATGMIWNGSVRPTKTDHWGTYAHERKELVRFLASESIDGVVLVGGDIHRSRVVNHATADVLGYDLLEVITSPLANRVIAAANQPHPGLEWDGDPTQSFALFNADTTGAEPSLEVRFLDHEDRTLYRLVRSGQQLRAK